MEWKARRELCSHGPATLLEECNEIDGGVSTSARAETPIIRQGRIGCVYWVMVETGGEGDHPFQVVDVPILLCS